VFARHSKKEEPPGKLFQVPSGGFALSGDDFDQIRRVFPERTCSRSLEGMNNKIKTMKRQAYGFRDLEFFKLRILAIHEAKKVLVG
jgi:hypothetical protein